MSDVLIMIICDNGELISEEAIFSLQNKIPNVIFEIKGLRTEDKIVE